MDVSEIKEKIESTFIGEYLVSILHCAESKIMPILIDDEMAVKKYYKKHTGKELNMENPQTFCEKLNWYKLNDRIPLMQQCADKVGVRDYIKSKGYGDYLNEIYGVYSNVKDINIETLPDRFVLKAAHGSHMNLIVKDKSKINWSREKMMMRTWLHQDIAWSGREWVYKDIPKRIVAEKYLEDAFGELRDYKFFCFNGKPIYIQYDIGRFSEKQYRNYYDINGVLLPLDDGVPSNPNEELTLSCEQRERMKKISTVLSKPFQQVRIDFYLVNEKIYIGEMTFFDGGGSTIFTQGDWNYKFSESWNVKNASAGGGYYQTSDIPKCCTL